MRYALYMLAFFLSLSSELGAQFRPLPKASEVIKLRELAGKSNSEAIYQLAICHIEEIGVEMDYMEAKELLEKAASAGDAPSMALLSRIHLGAPGIAKDKDTALRWAQKALESGHSSGQVAMAYFHFRGIGVPKSEQQAVRLLKKASETEVDALVELATIYLGGSATLKNEKEAFRLLNIAASRESRAAYVLLAKCYGNGIGTKQDAAAARAFAEKASALGSIEGGNILAGFALQESPPATEKAMGLLSKGVRHQNARSCYILGTIHLDGIGVTQSYYDACRLLRISAEKGDAYGLLAYANVCFRGRGRSTDETLGYACMIASSMLGNDEAQRYLDNIRHSDKQSNTYHRATSLAQSIVRQLESEELPIELQDNWHSSSFTNKGSIAPPSRRGRGIATGSGMIFSNSGHCFTNHHVIDGARTVKVRVPGRAEPLPATVVGSDEANDLAILKIDGWTSNGSALPALISCGRVKSGDKVFTVGYPLPSELGQEAKYTSGDISSLSGMEEDKRLMQISVPIQPGNSGGPLVLEDGKVVGVVVATLNASYMLRRRGALPQNVNFAVKSDYLIALAGTLGIEVPAPASQGKEPIEQIKANTIQVIAEN